MSVKFSNKKHERIKEGVLEVANYSFLLLTKIIAILRAKLIRSTKELNKEFCHSFLLLSNRPQDAHVNEMSLSVDPPAPRWHMALINPSKKRTGLDCKYCNTDPIFV